MKSVRASVQKYYIEVQKEIHVLQQRQVGMEVRLVSEDIQEHINSAVETTVATQGKITQTGATNDPEFGSTSLTG